MTKPQSFESLMADIDRLVEKLENPDTGLEESLRLFETGSRQISEARKRLRVIEHEFEILQKKFGDEPAVSPTPDQETSTPQESLGL